MDDSENLDIAEYFVAQSWVMLDEAKTIVEYAVENPSSNLEARLYDMMYEGVSKTLTEVNNALNANKTISEETKAAYRRDFQTYLKELQEWMIAAYRSKTLLYPQYKYLETQQKILFERVPEIKARYETPDKKNKLLTKNQLDISLMSPEARVLAVFADMPDLTMASIAKKAGVNRTSLYRMKKFMAVRKFRKDEEAASYKDAKSTGEKDGKTGDLKAWKK